MALLLLLLLLVLYPSSQLSRRQRLQYPRLRVFKVSSGFFGDPVVVGRVTGCHGLSTTKKDGLPCCCCFSTVSRFQRWRSRRELRILCRLANGSRLHPRSESSSICTRVEHMKTVLARSTLVEVDDAAALVGVTDAKVAAI